MLSRRRFLRFLATTPSFFFTLPMLRTTGLGASASLATGETLFVEAEAFDDLGGWDVDTQAMDVMGSPYLLAHGLGVPVRDASTDLIVPVSGEYRVWVRTRDWVAPWAASGAPGRFEVSVGGKKLDGPFGLEGADWHWQYGGVVVLEAGTTRVVLHDLTGFEGRCDAIVLSRNPAFVPPEDPKALRRFRYEATGRSESPSDGGEYDLVVAGGGLAGVCAALSAAQGGLRVALVQDRPVLGGNSSSEVRVWPEGHTRQAPYPRLGELVDSLVPERLPGDGNARSRDRYGDEIKLAAVRAQPNVRLMLGFRAEAVEMQGSRIAALVVRSTRDGSRTKLRSRLFADCTGDACVGYLAGADHEVADQGKMGASNLWNLVDTTRPEEMIKCECKDRDALGVGMQVGSSEQPFPRCPWALDLMDKPFPGRRGARGQWADTPLQNLGGWFWETGFDLDMVEDIERIRDQNLRAMYGAWDALKNVDGLYPNHRLNWVAFIAGKRESRRLIGDVVLTGDHFRSGYRWPDGVFPCSWHIDLHQPHPEFSLGLDGQEFISQATDSPEYRYRSPYWAPYRALYSRNVSNLFMAGRNISVDREGLGPVRVMRTTGMMGEVVGKSARLCVEHDTNPRGVYESHLPDLLALLNEGFTSQSSSLP